MANTWARTVLLVEMDLGAYTGQHFSLCCFPGPRCAIEALGIGWRLLSPPIILMTARPSAPQNSPDGAFSPVSFRLVAYGTQAFWRREFSAHGGQAG